MREGEPEAAESLSVVRGTGAVCWTVQDMICYGLYAQTFFSNKLVLQGLFILRLFLGTIEGETQGRLTWHAAERYPRRGLPYEKHSLPHLGVMR